MSEQELRLLQQKIDFLWKAIRKLPHDEGCHAALGWSCGCSKKELFEEMDVIEKEVST